jgi:hypothetical protein
LKASLAAPDANVINEDDRELDSSSSDEHHSEMEQPTKPNFKNRKVSDVYSDDYKNVATIENIEERKSN